MQAEYVKAVRAFMRSSERSQIKATVGRGRSRTLRRRKKSLAGVRGLRELEIVAHFVGTITGQLTLRPGVIKQMAGEHRPSCLELEAYR